MWAVRLQENGVRRLGLLGMGGIGKTMLAAALHDRLRSEFLSNSVCFVAEIRSRAGCMEEIQHLILNQLWSSDATRPHDKEEGTSWENMTNIFMGMVRTFVPESYLPVTSCN